MALVRLTTVEVELLVVMVYWIGMKSDLSKPGHQTTIRALAFIREAPWCVSCRSSNILLRPAVGMTTLVPHKTQPLSKDNSYFLEAYSVRAGSTVAGHHKVEDFGQNFVLSCNSLSLSGSDRSTR